MAGIASDGCEISVHLNDDVCVLRQRPAHARDVSTAETVLDRAVKHSDRDGTVDTQLVRNLARSVRGIVIHHEDVQVRDLQRGEAIDRLVVLTLVVCRYNDGYLRGDAFHNTFV